MFDLSYWFQVFVAHYLPYVVWLVALYSGAHYTAGLSFLVLLFMGCEFDDVKEARARGVTDEQIKRGEYLKFHSFVVGLVFPLYTSNLAAQLLSFLARPLRVAYTLVVRVPMLFVSVITGYIYRISTFFVYMLHKDFLSSLAAVMQDNPIGVRGALSQQMLDEKNHLEAEIVKLQQQLAQKEKEDKNKRKQLARADKEQTLKRNARERELTSFLVQVLGEATEATNANMNVAQYGNIHKRSVLAAAVRDLNKSGRDVDEAEIYRYLHKEILN